MTCRILNCSTNIENYYLCIEEGIIGFTQRRGAAIGDLVYLAVKLGKTTYYPSLCGARGRIVSATDERPWADADNYVQCFNIDNIEFCTPFELRILSTVSSDWSLKYSQAAKTIEDTDAIKLLDMNFETNKIGSLYRFNAQEIAKKKLMVDFDVVNLEKNMYSKIDLKNVPDKSNEKETQENLDIMGTFVTVKFVSETKGLEPLVTKNFYGLFGDDYPESRTVFIPENAKFTTSGVNTEDEKLSGIRGRPDAVLVKFNPQNRKCPFQINIIEYECYGENKTTAREKSNFFNGTIIPQLIRFASNFSIVTDTNIRRKTIEAWSDTIVSYVEDREDLVKKVSEWMKEMNPSISNIRVLLDLKSYLIQSFKSSIKILLIIDELTTEQKDTLNNIINAFRLGNGQEQIQFGGYTIRLQQRMNIFNSDFEYALSIQK